MRTSTPITPAIRARVIELKLAKVCSVEIRDELNLTQKQIDVIWQAYRKANPGTPEVGVGTHSKRRCIDPVKGGV